MDSGCPCDIARMYSKKNRNYEYKRAEANGTGTQQSAGVPVNTEAKKADEPGELVVSADAGSGGSGGGLEASTGGEAGADLVSGMKCAEGLKHEQVAQTTGRIARSVVERVDGLTRNGGKNTGLKDFQFIATGFMEML